MVVVKQILYVAPSTDWGMYGDSNNNDYAGIKYKVDWTFVSPGGGERPVSSYLLLPFAEGNPSVNWPVDIKRNTEELSAYYGRASDFHALILQDDDKIGGLIRSDASLRGLIADFIRQGKPVVAWDEDSVKALVECADPQTDAPLVQDIAVASYQSEKEKDAIYIEFQKIQQANMKMKDIYPKMVELGSKIRYQDGSSKQSVISDNKTLAGYLSQKQSICGPLDYFEKQLFDILSEGDSIGWDDIWKEKRSLEQIVMEWSEAANWLRNYQPKTDMSERDFSRTLFDRVVVDKNVMTGAMWQSGAGIGPKLVKALGL